MPITPGTRLGSYEVLSPLGAGGMGEVWRARDTKLGREVALKVLPASFAEDHERLARFEREAKVLASLNHTSIAGIYGLHEQDGIRFLTMEMVPGEDLAERLKRGPVPVAEALEYARQIAEALEVAHEQGIVHRDLKPANVRLTPDGKVKVLDFGLAKALESAATSNPGREPAMSPTITSLGTVAGVILGTAAYMSPEQARGKAVDKRADIWAFGCVLYEMLTGTRPFDGETISDTLAAVLAREADWDALPSTVPVKVRDLLQRCLEKDPKRRLRDIGDARIELDQALADRTASGRVRVAAPVEIVTAKAPTKRWVFAALVLGGVLAGLMIGSQIARRGSSHDAPRVVRLDLAFPTDARIFDYTISPDGSAIAAIGAPRVPPGETQPLPRLYLRRLDAGTMTVVPGTEDAQFFSFSADGKYLIVTLPTASGATQRSVVRIPVDGRTPPFTVAPWNPRWTTASGLNAGGAVALQDGTDLVRIPASGGDPSTPVKVDLAGERGQITLARHALPGDNATLLSTIAYGAKGWYYRVGVLDLKAARITYLFDDGGSPVYAPSGHIVFTRGDSLLAIGFDASSLKVTGSPVPLANGFLTRFSFQPAAFDLSNDGVLVYERGGRTAEGRRIGVVDASGSVTPISDERHPYQWLSTGLADGQRFVATITNGQGIDELWVGELDRPGLRRVVAIPDADILQPIMSRDGRRVVFGRRGRSADDGIYVKTLDDPAPPRKILSLPPDDIRTNLWSFMPDGSGVFLNRAGADGNADIYFAPIRQGTDASSELKPVVVGPGDEFGAAVSPDGRWLAYASSQSGRAEVYVAALGPGVNVGDTLRVTKSGGGFPVWTADGRAIRYRELSGREMSMSVATSPALSVGAPTLAFDAAKLNVFAADMFADGRQLVTIRGEEEADEIRRLAVVLHFDRELLDKMKAAK